MRIALHTPFGNLSRESGLIYLLGNYLKGFHEVVQLRCNGLFPVCDRDSETGWKRSIDHCIKCTSDQSNLARWSSIPTSDLSSFLKSEEVVDTRRWILETPATVLHRLNLKGVDIYRLCQGSFQSRMGTKEPDLLNKKHEPMMRRILLSAARACLAVKRFHNIFSPEVCFIAGGDDFISQAFYQQSRLMRKDVVLFAMDMNQRCIRVVHPREERSVPCQMLLTDVTVMRPDVKTWPVEVVSEIEGLLSYLDIFQGQIDLPLAR